MKSTLSFTVKRLHLAAEHQIAKVKGMIRNLSVSATILAAVLFSQVATAACTDPPGPGVNWQRCTFDGLDFKEVDLTGARLRDSSFFRSDLSKSDLSNTRSFRVKFVNAVMTEVTLDGSHLQNADFTKADLTNASLVGVDLRRARMFRANLRGADLTDVRLNGADITRADLSGATWTDGKRICAEGSVGRCN